MAVEPSSVQSYEKQVGNSYFFSPFSLISRRFYKKESRRNFDCTNVASPGMVGSVAETDDRTSSYTSMGEKTLTLPNLDRRMTMVAYYMSGDNKRLEEFHN